MLLLSLFLGVPSIPVFLKTLNVKRSHLLMASVARAVVPFGSVCGSFLLWHTHVPPPQGQIVYFGLPSNSRVILGCLIIWWDSHLSSVPLPHRQPFPSSSCYHPPAPGRAPGQGEDSKTLTTELNRWGAPTGLPDHLMMENLAWQAVNQLQWLQSAGWSQGTNLYAPPTCGGTASSHLSYTEAHTHL